MQLYINSFKNLGMFEDEAHTLAYLASSSSSYVTGQTINVKGGILLFKDFYSCKRFFLC